VAPYRRHGTFVTAKPVEQAWLDLPTTGGPLLRAYDGLDAEWLSAGAAGVPDVSVPNGASWATKYYCMQRLYRRDTLPVVLEQSHLAEDAQSIIGLLKLKQRPTLSLLHDKSLIHSIEQRIHFGVADQDIARRMGLDLNAPLAIMDLWAFNSSRTVTYFSTAYYSGAVVRVGETITPTRKK
jgi:DNA-binding GntR family transcriptional regulator